MSPEPNEGGLSENYIALLTIWLTVDERELLLLLIVAVAKWLLLNQNINVTLSNDFAIGHFARGIDVFV
ncbi:hypothetical protein GCM10027342_43120 [Photobacterium alginatilyticum]